MSSWHPKRKRNRPLAVRKIRHGKDNIQEVLMDPSTHSREGLVSKNLSSTAKEKELQHVAATCFETEIATWSLSRGMGMVEAGETKGRTEKLGAGLLKEESSNSEELALGSLQVKIVLKGRLEEILGGCLWWFSTWVLAVREEVPRKVRWRGERLGGNGSILGGIR